MVKLPDYSLKKFLIVDDMPFMLDLIHRMLVECGATHIVKACDGASALKLIRDDLSQVDFIIADCNMKPVNGLQLLQAVRSGINPSIPRDQAFIMLTGVGDASIVKLAKLLDVSGYLVKPTSLEKLVEALERIATQAPLLREREYYEAIKLLPVSSLDKLNDADPDKKHKRSGWVVMPQASQQANRDRIKSKIDVFKVEHTSRDGEEEVKIKNIRQCSLVGLAAGMILAEDVLADEDHILAKRGARLNVAMIKRLQELAVESGSRDHVWVGYLDTK